MSLGGFSFFENGDPGRSSSLRRRRESSTASRTRTYRPSIIKPADGSETTSPLVTLELDARMNGKDRDARSAYRCLQGSSRLVKSGQLHVQRLPSNLMVYDLRPQVLFEMKKPSLTRRIWPPLLTMPKPRSSRLVCLKWTHPLANSPSCQSYPATASSAYAILVKVASVHVRYSLSDCSDCQQFLPKAPADGIRMQQTLSAHSWL